MDYKSTFAFLEFFDRAKAIQNLYYDHCYSALYNQKIGEKVDYDRILNSLSTIEDLVDALNCEIIQFENKTNCDPICSSALNSLKRYLYQILVCKNLLFKVTSRLQKKANEFFFSYPFFLYAKDIKTLDHSMQELESTGNKLQDDYEKMVYSLKMGSAHDMIDILDFDDRYHIEAKQLISKSGIKYYVSTSKVETINANAETSILIWNMVGYLVESADILPGFCSYITFLCLVPFVHYGWFVLLGISLGMRFIGSLLSFIPSLFLFNFLNKILHFYIKFILVLPIICIALSFFSYDWQVGIIFVVADFLLNLVSLMTINSYDNRLSYNDKVVDLISAKYNF